MFARFWSHFDEWTDALLIGAGFLQKAINCDVTLTWASRHHRTTAVEQTCSSRNSQRKKAGRQWLSKRNSCAWSKSRTVYGHQWLFTAETSWRKSRAARRTPADKTRAMENACNRIIVQKKSFRVFLHCCNGTHTGPQGRSRIWGGREDMSKLTGLLVKMANAAIFSCADTHVWKLIVSSFAKYCIEWQWSSKVWLEEVQLGRNQPAKDYVSSWSTQI